MKLPLTVMPVSGAHTFAIVDQDGKVSAEITSCTAALDMVYKMNAQHEALTKLLGQYEQLVCFRNDFLLNNALAAADHAREVLK